MQDPTAVQPAPHAFRRLMIASEGGHGLRQLGRLAACLAADDATVELAEIVCNPAAVFPAVSLDYPDWRDAHHAMLLAARDAMASAAHHLTTPTRQVETHLIDLSSSKTLDAALALTQAARTWHADLLAVASHQSGHRWGCRLEPEEVVGYAECPVLHVPASCLECEPVGPRRVLCALDGGRASLNALRDVLAMLADDVAIRVVYVVDKARHPHDRLLYELFECEGFDALEAAGGLPGGRRARVEAAMIDTEDALDDVAAAVLREARRWQADLIVMGSEGRWPERHPLPGTVARRTLRGASCPVLIYPRMRPLDHQERDAGGVCAHVDPNEVAQLLFL